MSQPNGLRPAPAAGPALVEVIRGNMVECVHNGALAISRPDGTIIASMGEPDRIIYSRSSCKMLQALPLLESGAADAYALGTEQLALACASHQGAEIHTSRVNNWLANIGLSEADLRCGPQEPNDRPARDALICSGHAPDQTCNNCSGKHSGFLTLNKHIGGNSEYHEPSHPVQQAVKQAFYEMTEDADDLGYGIDGCSAPNFASSLSGLALAMAKMAAPQKALSGKRAEAAGRLVEAMYTHPELVAGETRACTELMRAGNGRFAIKTGAEAVFTGIIPELELGIAVKIDDGGTRAAEAVIAELLVRLGVLDADHPATIKRRNPALMNRRKVACGEVRVSQALRELVIS